MSRIYSLEAQLERKDWEIVGSVLDGVVERAAERSAI